jgi:hypothetical protein
MESVVLTVVTMKGIKFSDVSKVGKCGVDAGVSCLLTFRALHFQEVIFITFQVVTITAPSKHLHCNNFLLICVGHSTELFHSTGTST